MAMEFIGDLPDEEAMRAIAAELRTMPDHSIPIAEGETKTIAGLIEDLENGTEVGIEFLALRRRAEKTIKGMRSQQ